MDSPPVIYVLEDHPKLGPRFQPLFEAHAAGRLRFAVTTVAIAEILTGPLHKGDAAALVTHDRDFARVRALRIIS